MPKILSQQQALFVDLAKTNAWLLACCLTSVTETHTTDELDTASFCEPEGTAPSTTTGELSFEGYLIVPPDPGMADYEDLREKMYATDKTFNVRIAGTTYAGTTPTFITGEAYFTSLEKTGGAANEYITISGSIKFTKKPSFAP